MNNDYQTQKAGNNSTQIQATNVTIVQGIDEKRAREIYAEMYEVAKRDLSKSAYDKANDRVKKLEDLLIPKMEQIDGALNSFADPSFQVLLTKASKTAACTEREPDYNLLSELLIHRITKKDSRKDIAGISRAVEIVDKIDDDALCGLTVFHAGSTLFPIAQDVIQGLNMLENLFSKLITSELPKETEWIEHLDILDAIRYSQMGKLKSIETYWTENMSGFICIRIKKDSENYFKAKDLLHNNRLHDSCLQKNALLPGYYRIPVINEKEIDNLSIVFDTSINQHICLTENQKVVLHEIYKLYTNDAALQEQVRQNFIKEIEKRPSLKALKIWWNSIPYALHITAVGRVLAHANAQRLAPTIPPLNK